MNQINKIIVFVATISLLIGIVYAADFQNIEKPLKKVQPVVKLKTLNDKITNSTDGLIEIYVDNPSQNALNIDVEANGDVYFFGQIFPLDGAVGVAVGNFVVSPGQQKTESIIVKSNILGKHPVKINVEYYTEANKDVLIQKISFKQTFKVEKSTR